MPKDSSPDEETSLGWLVAAYLIAAVIFVVYALALRKKISATSDEIAEMHKKLG